MNVRRSTFLPLALVVLTIAACASGSAIVSGTTKAPVAPEQVKIFLEPPAEFEVIGVVHASSSAGMTEQGSMDFAIGELKKQAAKLGANGVLLISSSERTTNIYGGKAKTVQGKAIFVKEL